jgi:hypothetical protein
MNAVIKATPAISRQMASKIDELSKLRREKGIPTRKIADAMGYKGDASVYDIEHMNINSSGPYRRYIQVTGELCETATPGAKPILMPRKSPDPTGNEVDAKTLIKFRECREIRRASGVSGRFIADEMGFVDRPITWGMIAHFEKERHLTRDRALSYIAAVQKLCAAPQIAITIPAPIEPPAATPAAPHTAGRSVLELLAILNQCNEELARHRAAWAAMMGRDDDAEWNNQLATFSKPRTP